MATWAIGDVQGCLDSLKNLLQEIGFDDQSDRLWLLGDLVGRGPDPCGVLDLVISMVDCAACVLVNNDLQLDVRAGKGLNTNAADYFVGAGLSIRFR